MSPAEYIELSRAAFGGPFVSSPPNYTATNLAVFDELTSPRQNRSFFLGG